MSNLNSLPLPKKLVELIESGLWPVTEQDSLLQNQKSLVPKERVKAFAPDEEKNCIYFYRPPFQTVQQLKENGEKFWSWPLSAAHELDANLTLLIGDFGLGSDAPVALDYRKNINNPSVIRLKWSQEAVYEREQENNHWVEVAATFEDSAKMITE